MKLRTAKYRWLGQNDWHTKTHSMPQASTIGRLALDPHSAPCPRSLLTLRVTSSRVLPVDVRSSISRRILPTAMLTLPGPSSSWDIRCSVSLEHRPLACETLISDPTGSGQHPTGMYGRPNPHPVRAAVKAHRARRPPASAVRTFQTRAGYRPRATPADRWPAPLAAGRWPHQGRLPRPGSLQRLGAWSGLPKIQVLQVPNYAGRGLHGRSRVFRRPVRSRNPNLWQVTQ